MMNTHHKSNERNLLHYAHLQLSPSLLIPLIQILSSVPCMLITTLWKREPAALAD